MKKQTKVKAILFEQGRSQKWLSEQTGIPESYLSMFITGKLVLDEDTKRKIAVALAMPAKDLFE